MVAIAKEMFFPFLGNAAKAEVVQKPAAKAVVKDERTALIDKMVAAAGLDYSARIRYFKLAQNA